MDARPQGPSLPSELLDTVVAKCGELLEAEQAITRAQACVVRAAVGAEQQVNRHFDQLSSYHQHLRATVHTVRKLAWTRANDTAVATRGLRCALAGMHHPAHASSSLEWVLDNHAAKVREWPQGVVVGFVWPGDWDWAVWRAACRVLPVSEDGRWAVRQTSPTPLAPMHLARRCAAGVVVGDSPMVVGGSGGSGGALSSCEVLDTVHNTWATTPRPMLVARESCGACVVGRFVVVVGGFDNHGRVVDHAEAFDSEFNSWVPLSRLPSPVEGPAVVASDGKVLVFGGRNAAGFCTAAVWLLDVETGHKGGALGTEQWVTLEDMPCVRYYPGGTLGQGHVFLCGGYSDAEGRALDRCDLFNPSTGHWAPLPPLPTPLYMCGCCYGGGNVFVAGGCAGWRSQAGVFVYRTSRGAWGSLRSLATPRWGCAAVCVERRLLVFGGLGEPCDLASCEAFQF